MTRTVNQPEKFQMRVSPEFLKLVDEWRRHQPDIPPRAEAIRRLVERGIRFSELWGQVEGLASDGLVTKEVVSTIADRIGLGIDDHDPD